MAKTRTRHMPRPTRHAPLTTRHSSRASRAQALPLARELYSLDLTGNAICGVDPLGGGKHNAAGVRALAMALEANGSLRRLSIFRHNQLDAASNAALRHALRRARLDRERSGKRCGGASSGNSGSSQQARRFESKVNSCQIGASPTLVATSVFYGPRRT